MEKAKYKTYKMPKEVHDKLKKVAFLKDTNLINAMDFALELAINETKSKDPQETIEKLETFNKQVNYLYDILKLTVDFSSPPLMAFGEKSIVSTYDDTIIVEMEKYANILKIGDIVKIGTKKCLVLDFSSSFGSPKIQALAIHKEEMDVKTNQ